MLPSVVYSYGSEPPERGANPKYEFRGASLRMRSVNLTNINLMES
jgi:hypothetical protein